MRSVETPFNFVGRKVIRRLLTGVSRMGQGIVRGNGINENGRGRVGRLGWCSRICSRASRGSVLFDFPVSVYTQTRRYVRDEGGCSDAARRHVTGSLAGAACKRVDSWTFARSQVPVSDTHRRRSAPCWTTRSTSTLPRAMYRYIFINIIVSIIIVNHDRSH